MKKRIMAIIMSACVAAGLFYTGGIPAFADSNIVCVEDSDNTAYDIQNVKGSNSNCYLVSYKGKVQNVLLPSKNVNAKNPEKTTLTEIAAGAFSDNETTKNVQIPNTVTKIDIGFIDDNYTIENIIVSETNNSYSSADGILYNPDKTELIKCPNTRTYVKVPDGVKTLGQYSFSDDSTGKKGYSSASNISMIKAVSIPKSVENIEEGAFHDCYDLTDVYYEGTEDDWKNISIVNGSTGLNDIVVSQAQIHYEQYEAPTPTTEPVGATATAPPDPSGSTSTAAPTADPASGQAIAVTDQSVVVTDQAVVVKPTDVPKHYYPTPAVPTAVPRSYATNAPVNTTASASPAPGIQTKHISRCIGEKIIYSVDVTDDGKLIATVIGVLNKNVKSLVIPSSITIGEYDYQVTGIAAKAISGCKKLKKVIIGKNVKKIGKNAFKNCKKLKSVAVLSKKLTTVGNNAFKGIVAKAEILLPKKKFAALKKKFAKSGLSSKTKYKKIVVL